LIFTQKSEDTWVILIRSIHINNNYSREKKVKEEWLIDTCAMIYIHIYTLFYFNNGSIVVVVFDFRSNACVETTKENKLSLVIHNGDWRQHYLSAQKEKYIKEEEEENWEHNLKYSFFV
jgi:hypothetical protein